MLLNNQFMNIEKILNSVLTDTAPVKPMKICHYKDVEIFFNDSQRSQQPCIYFMKGTCNKGSECSYSHSLIDSTPRNNKYKTTLCDNWKM